MDGHSQFGVADRNLIGAPLEQLERVCVNLDRRYCSTPASYYSSRVEGNRFLSGDNEYLLDHLGWQALAAGLKAPFKYWSSFDEGARAQIANLHLRQYDHHGMDVVACDGVFRGFRLSHLVHLSSAKVIRALQAGLGLDAPHFTVHKTELTDNTLRVELVTPRRAQEVRPGDLVQGGLTLSHSFVGEHGTAVDLYSLRLACQNGMTHRSCKQISRSRRLKAKDEGSTLAAMEQLERLVQGRLKHLDELLACYRTLPDKPITEGNESPEAAMKAFLLPELRRSKLWSEKLWKDELLEAWQNEQGGAGQSTRYAAVNTVTYVATHSKMSFRQRQVLARLAGLITYRDVHFCEKCHQAVLSA